MTTEERKAQMRARGIIACSDCVLNVSGLCYLNPPTIVVDPGYPHNISQTRPDANDGCAQGRGPDWNRPPAISHQGVA